MNCLIINSYPYEGSFNRSAAKSIEEILDKKENCEQSDLVADGFDPVIRANDLHLWGKGETIHPLLTLAYPKKIEWADTIIFLFPV